MPARLCAGTNSVAVPCRAVGHERRTTVGKLLDESLVTGLPPFLGLAREQVRLILDESVSQRHDVGASVFSEGSAATQFFLLLDGHVRAQRTTPNGEQVILHQIPPGELFGIARAMGLDAYPATAVVVAESIVLAWPMRLWEPFMARFAGFAQNTFRTVGARMHDKNDRIMEMATLAVEQRISNALLRLVNQSGAQDAARHRNRLPDHPSGPFRDERHHFAHGQPHAQRVGKGRDRAKRT